MNLLLPNQERLRWAQRLIWLNVALAGAHLLVQGYCFTVLGRATAAETGMPPGAYGSVYHSVQRWLGPVQGLALVLAGVTFLLWWHRSLVNFIRLGYPTAENPGKVPGRLRW
ncbi:hypothetical protein [Deinococcus sp.]|uniref:hypothetical protein n=1 Tax=Deinococcus sp. TaxID=47478 RepID=UPI0025C2A33D|nr:hypothetical protein [Deinococcus sp.]